MKQHNIPFSCADLDLSYDSSPEHFDCPRVSRISDLPYSVNLFHINPPEFLNWVVRWRKRTRFDLFGSTNAMVPFWELPELPTLWRDVMMGLDVVLAPTEFIADTIRRSVPEHNLPEIISYPQSVAPPAGVSADRTRWLGSYKDAFAVLFAFDAASDVERKNPAAAVRAFQKAFPKGEDAVFLLKVSRAHHASGPQWEAVTRAASEDVRIRLMHEHLDRRDLWELFASIDTFLSLHRAEGLGLGIMEAMAVGKPVVVTAWSGNMDFTDQANALLVPFEKIAVANVTNANYAGMPHLRWAEPDIDEAARSLRSLYESPELRSRLGESGRLRMRQMRESPAAVTALNRVIEGAGSDGSSHAARYRQIISVSRRNYPEYRGSFDVVGQTKRHVVKLLRYLHLKPPGPGADPPALIVGKAKPEEAGE